MADFEITHTREQDEEGYERPAAQVDEQGRLTVRASMIGYCKRRLSFVANGVPESNPWGENDPESKETILETGKAMEPVIAMSLEKFHDYKEVELNDSNAPLLTVMKVTPHLTITGHYDATGVAPGYELPTVLEFKTRNSNETSKMRRLGVDRSHPESVVQGAFYAFSMFEEMRDFVVATHDKNNSKTYPSVIQTPVGTGMLNRRLNAMYSLSQHYLEHGPGTDILAEREYNAYDIVNGEKVPKVDYSRKPCDLCPFRSACIASIPGEAERVANEMGVEEDIEEDHIVTFDEFIEAANQHREAHAIVKRQEVVNAEKTKKRASKIMIAYFEQVEEDLYRSEDIRVKLVKTPRASFDKTSFHHLVPPELREQIESEKVSKSVRVT